MPSRVFEPSDDVTVYLVLNDHGQFGLAYDEADPGQGRSRNDHPQFP
jgi:hypothetical protein